MTRTLTFYEANYRVGAKGGLVQNLFLFLLFILLSSCTQQAQNQSGGYQVSVTRDAYNQPIIKVTQAPSADLADKRLMEEQGYIMAKDRFLQMDLMRRLPEGKLAEIFGERAYSSDKDVWTIANLPQAIQRSEARIYKDFRPEYDLLDAFSNGVNRYLAELPTDSSDQGRELRRKYQLFTSIRGQIYQPDAWVPADSIAIMKVATYFLSSSFYQKVAFGVVAAKVGNPLDFKKLFDFRPMMDVSILKTGLTSEPVKISQQTLPLHTTSSLFADLTGEDLKGLEKNEMGSLPLCPRAFGVYQGCDFLGQPGSNNWALSPRFTKTGQTILANDPHLTLRMPTALYEGAYDSTPAGGTFATAGVQFAGMPGALIGHNKNLAWVLTNNAADVEDLFFEQMDEKGANYRFVDDKYYPVRSEAHTIQVRLADGSLVPKPPITIRYTHDIRPIISDHIEVDGEKLSNLMASKELSYQWTGHTGTSEVAAILRMNRAGTMAEFRDSLNAIEVGAQNVVYANTHGDIAYYSPSKYPIRNTKMYSVDKGVVPYVPVDGTGDFEWLGFREKMPEIPAGKADRIVTANDDPYGYNQQENFGNFKDYFGFGFSPGTRKARILSLLDEKRAEKGYVTVDDVKAVQTDHMDLAALKFIEVLREAELDLDDVSLAASKLYMERLLHWSGIASKDRTEPLYYMAWLRAMLVTFYRAEFLDIKLAKDKIEDVNKYLKRIGMTPYGITRVYHWLKDAIKGENEKERDRAAQFLKATIEIAWKDMQGAGWNYKRWGQVHVLRFDNPFKIFLPDSLVPNIERDGTYDTVDVSGFPVDGVYDHLPKMLPTHMGPNLRLIMVLEQGKPITGLNALPGGNWDIDTQKDLLLRDLRAWSNGEYRTLVSLE